jgi:hypothetical protein
VRRREGEKERKREGEKERKREGGGNKKSNPFGVAFYRYTLNDYFFLEFCLLLPKYWPFLKPLPSWLPTRSIAQRNPMVALA